MADVDVAQWLEQWVEENVHAGSAVGAKAVMHDEARACAEAAKSAGISVIELKEAANGDLETFLMERHTIASGKEAGGV